ncbi:hypothetical protein [Variovorax sp. Sphag1AA]|uniref:hypothetical protein n=1 Tax=Variovorax sp. Sphag1AA TaxID=2587027 RepID=UPI00160C8D92|nr:hypothetical protein [Variovorax sp. Sphag1AA]MBB3178493.1 hypothetical protein [Variovorax sp. Sphag1AA]
MRLLRRIAATNRLTELVGLEETRRAEDYERKGWVTIRRTRMIGGGPDDFQTVYAQITDAGRDALRGGSD